jgi:hypothetical protein
MRYRIIITQNGKKKKILYEGNSEDIAKVKYYKIRDNNKVLFPKKSNAYKKIKSVTYEIIFLKEKEENDIVYFERDGLGRVTPINIKSDRWTIIHKDEYFYEEKFTVFGFDYRLETKDILKSVLLKKSKEDNIKMINYVINKVLIHQNGDFDIITCKNSSDAKRLYLTIKEFCDHNKINNVVFTGLVGYKSRTKLYKRISEKTGWSMNKTYRTSTRP